MQNITQLMGHSGGPMGAKIEPRSCKYCHYFGHTRQFCKKRAADEEREVKRLLREHGDCATKLAQIAEGPWVKWCGAAEATYAELVAIRCEWTDEEWKREFHKRVEQFNFKKHWNGHTYD
jgi:hypothetical protein